MKKIVFIFLSLVILASCKQDDGFTNNNYTGSEVAYFTDGNASSYFVTPDADVFVIQVGATSLSTSDRTYGLEIDEESTAIEGVDFSLLSNTVTIAAGEYFSQVSVQGIFEGTTADGSNLVLNLVAQDGNGVASSGSATYTLNIVQLCVSDIGGSYSVTTTYGFHDFLPDYSTNTMDIDVVEIGPGFYEVFDFSGGLYSSGPYSGAYGTGDSSFTVQFTENCGLISWEGQSDPWGAVIPLDGGVNEVDLNTGIITTSWFAEGYGENGVSIYTPI